MATYITPGFYKARAVASDIGVSDNKGTPFVSVTFEITEGEFEGKMIDWKGWNTEKTAERLVDDLRTLGYAGSDPEDLASLGAEEVAEKLPSPVSLKIQDEEYKGNVRSIVRFINPVHREPTAGVSLFADMKAAFAAKPAGKSIAKPNGGPRQRPAQMTDDDIPF